ncbi:MAG: hypothetical protein JSS72_13170 [Armatimonadetes bacterium]|nr:hypothetical protein [Armatimonadota bacterium]
MNVFICAGEASGDRYGAAFAHHLKGLAEFKIHAVGGPLLRAGGAQMVEESSRWGAIGIAQALMVAVPVMLAEKRIKRALAGMEPGLFVPIDFGYINVRLARFAKQHGWKVFYFVPPGSWRRDRQGADLPAVTNAIATPFEWSAKLLNEAGANARWLGHPIKELIKAAAPQSGAREGVAVLPGSREHEISLNLPLIAQVLAGYEGRIEFGLAPSVNLEQVKALWGNGPKAEFTQGDLYGVLSRAKAALACSGTVTLETALCRTPMVVIYKLSPMQALQGRLMGLAGKSISLPNILLQRTVVPEFADAKLDPQEIRARLYELLEDTPERTKQLEAFQELDQLLGPDNGIEAAAQWAAEIALG